MLLPNNLLFKVTIMDPIHTITKTSANSGPPSFEFAFSVDPCKILKIKYLYHLNQFPFSCNCLKDTYIAMKVHKTKGPQRSPKIKLIRIR